MDLSICPGSVCIYVPTHMFVCNYKSMSKSQKEPVLGYFVGKINVEGEGRRKKQVKNEY